MYRHYKDFSNTKGSYTLTYMSDEDYRSQSCGEVKNSEDYNLKEDNTEQGGLYDVKIFGAVGKCKCGKTRTVNHTCPNCKVRVLDETTYKKQFAIYELTYPYSSSFKLKILINHLLDVGIDIMGKRATVASTENEKLIQMIWSLEFVAGRKYPNHKDNIRETEDSITFIMDDGTPFMMKYIDKTSTTQFIGLNGLLQMARYNFNGKPLSFIKHYINSILYISSPALRPARAFVQDGKKVISLPQQSQFYKIIIETDKLIKHETGNMASVMCLMNVIIDRILMNSKLLASSKQSLLRNSLNVRLDLTLRGNISPDNGLKLNEVGIPKSALYLTLQHQIIEQLKQHKDPKIALNAEYLYNKNDPLAWEIMRDIIEPSAVLFQRSPVLHKLGVLALKIQPIESDIPVIKMNPVLATPFNADYDGDQMLCIIETDPKNARRLLAKMSPENVWRYDKNQKPIWCPDHEQLVGLIYASMVNPSGRTKKYMNKQQVYNDVENKKLKIDELITIGNKQTSYGRLKLKDILGTDLDLILEGSEKMKIINKDNIGQIIAGLQRNPRRLEIINELIELSNQFATTIGIDTPPRKDLTKNLDDSIKHIQDDPELTEEQKYDQINKVIEDGLKKSIADLPNTNFKTIFESSGRVKMQQLKGLYAKNVYQNLEGKTLVGDSTIIGGLNEKDLYLAAQNARAIFKVKKDSVPIAGYNTRQLEGKLNKFAFSREKAKGNYTIKIPKGLPEFLGREIVRSDNDFHYYRSLCSRPLDNTIHFNEFRQEIFLPTIEDMAGNEYDIDARLAQSWGQTIMESVSQSFLGLKYGAQEQSLENEYVQALFDGEVVSNDGNWLTVSDGKNNWKYVLTEKSTVPPQLKPGATFKKGDKIILSNNMRRIQDITGPIAAFLGFQVAGEKIAENMAVSYAVQDGRIQYSNKFFNCGDMRQGINQKLIYKYPEGWNVKYGDRISSGVLNLKKLMTFAGKNEVEAKQNAFYLFYKEFLLLTGNSRIEPELIEPIFAILVDSKGVSLKSFAKERTDILDSMYAESPKQAFATSTLNHKFKPNKVVQEHEATPLTDLMLRLYS